MRDLMRRIWLSAAVLLAAGVLATPAFSADALFQGSVNRFHYGYYTTFATVMGTNAGPTLMVQDGVTTTAASFTIPSNAFDGGNFSYSAAFPGYPYFGGYRDRFMTSGAFAKSFKVPGTSYTIMRPNSVGATQYPNALPTSPIQAYMRVQAGSKGFGGFWGVVDLGTLSGIVVTEGGGGYSSFFFKPMNYGAVTGLAKGYDHDGGKNNFATLGYSNAQTRCCQYSNITNTGMTSQMIGGIGVHMAGVGHLTGTVTISGPAGYATKVTYAGADNRTSMGLSGTISMVAPQIIVNYFTADTPTFDQTTPVDFLSTSAPDVVITALQFLPVPEPSQFALVAAGVIGLLGYRRMGRR